MKGFGYKSVTLTPAELRLIRSVLAKEADEQSKIAYFANMADPGGKRPSLKRAAACRELKKRLKAGK